MVLNVIPDGLSLQGFRGVAGEFFAETDGIFLLRIISAEIILVGLNVIDKLLEYCSVPDGIHQVVSVLVKRAVGVFCIRIRHSTLRNSALFAVHQM